MMELYAYAVTARFKKSPTEIQLDTNPGALKAENKHEALGMAQELAKDIFSDPKYFDHKASVVNIPLTFLRGVIDR